MMLPRQSRQPTPEERLGSNRTRLARRGCALRSVIPPMSKLNEILQHIGSVLEWIFGDDSLLAAANPFTFRDISAGQYPRRFHRVVAP